MTVHNEQERVWKEAVVAQFQVISRSLPGGIEENFRISTARVAFEHKCEAKRLEPTKSATQEICSIL
jgi:hypothetical protein